MQTIKFPYIALGLGLFLMLVITQGSQDDGEGGTRFPLLALLAISELAFFMCGFGVWFGYRDMRGNGVQPVMAGTTAICAVMAVAFAWLGVSLWPGLGAL